MHDITEAKYLVLFPVLSPLYSYLENYTVKLPESILRLPSNSNSPAMDHTAGLWAWITSHWCGLFHTRMELWKKSWRV